MNGKYYLTVVWWLLLPQSVETQKLNRKLLRLFSLLFVSIAAGLSLHVSIASAAMPESDSFNTIGANCGNGERLQETTLCVHGIVWFDSQEAGATAQNGVTVTISTNGVTVTDTTYVHAGQALPTYGIDISGLQPEFLEPITITVDLGEQHITRIVPFYPAFDTLSQEVNFWVPAAGSLNPAGRIWGTVTDFVTGRPVSEALVTLTLSNGQIITDTTVWSQVAQSPIYEFGDLNLEAGDVVTLTASYNDFIEERLIVLGDAPIQQSFVLGWKCQGFDPLPRTTPGIGGDRLPRTTPGIGGDRLPDVACIWGFIKVDTIEIEGVTLQLFLEGELIGETKTRVYRHEKVARYAIPVKGVSNYDDVNLEIVAAYGGQIESESLNLTLDAGWHQQIDLDMYVNTHSLNNVLSSFTVNDMEWHDGYLWLATSNNGVVRSDGTNSFTQWGVEDGLPQNSIRGVEITDDGTVWVVSTRYSFSFLRPGEKEWETIVTPSVTSSYWSGDFRISPTGQYIYYIRRGSSANQNDPIYGAYREYYIYKYYVQLGIWEEKSWKLYTDGQHALATAEFDDSGILWTAVFEPNIEPNFVNNGYNYRIRIFGVDIDNHTGSQIDSTVNNHHVHYLNWSDDYYLASPFGTYMRTNGHEFLLFGLGYVWHAPPYGGWFNYPVSSDFYDSAFDDKGENWVLRYDQVFTFGSGHFYLPSYANSDYPQTGNKRIVVGGGNVYVDIGNGRITSYNIEQAEVNEYKLAEMTGKNVGAVQVNSTDTIWNFSQRLDTGRAQLVSHQPFNNAWEIIDCPTCAASLVTNSAIDKNDSIWGLDAYGIIRYSPVMTTAVYSYFHQLPLSTTFTTLTNDSDGDIWLTNNTLIQHNPLDESWQVFTPTASIALTNTFHTSAADTQNNIWLGNDNGLARFKPETETWTHWHSGNSPLPRNTINVVEPAADQIVWLATSQELVHFDVTAGQWISFTTQNSNLQHSNIKSLSATNDGGLWIAYDNNYGLSYFDFDTNYWKHFTDATGLTSNKLYDLAVASDNSVWIGADSGVSHLFVPKPQGDIGVTLSGPERLAGTKPFTLTLGVTNLGSTEAPTVVTITLPVDAVQYQTTLTATEIAPAVWDFGRLAPSEGVTWTMWITPTAPWPVGEAISTTLLARTSSAESFLSNNFADIETLILDPERADVGINLSAPPLLVPGSLVTYTLYFGNGGGLTAANTTIEISFPSELTPIGYSQQSSLSIGDLTAELAAESLDIPVLVGMGPLPEMLSVTAVITSSTPDSDARNDQSILTTLTALDDSKTLFVTAQDRAVTHWGPSDVFNQLNTLALHDKVQGSILDVTRDAEISAAFDHWDANPLSIDAANQVSHEIKRLIEQYLIDYPNLEYVVLVGGDDIIPFYRIKDLSYISPESVYYPSNQALNLSRTGVALRTDYFLSDDFYVDREPELASRPDKERTIYLPDFALGRLVETPEQIVQVIAAFIENNGEVTIDRALVGADAFLADDLQQDVCDLVRTVGLAADCTSDPAELKEWFTTHNYNFMLFALHADHQVMGPFLEDIHAQDFLNGVSSIHQSVVTSIGCHAGLNVPESEIDFAETIQGLGGSYIAPTAYAYAVSFDPSEKTIGYSEEWSQALTQRLLSNGSLITLGQAVMDTKLDYYFRNSALFDALDEKVLQSMTLYGLPMTEIHTGYDMGFSDTSSSTAVVETTFAEDAGSHTVETLALTDLSPSVVLTYQYGTVLDYGTSYYVNHGSPIQPYMQVPLENSYGDQTVRSIRIKRAVYDTYPDFDPIIAQAWPFSQLATITETAIYEPPAGFSGRDHDIFATLAQFDGLPETQIDDQSAINLLLGIYDGNAQAEFALREIELDVLHSSSSDITPPEILSVTSRVLPDDRVEVTVSAQDNDGLESGQLLYDTGVILDVVTLYPLTTDQQLWRAYLPSTAQLVHVQIFDGGYNQASQIYEVADMRQEAEQTDFDFSATYSGGEVDFDLNYSVVGCEYQIYRSTSPYGRYQLWQSNLTLWASTDSLVYDHQFYFARAVNCGSNKTYVSAEIGLFSFVLESGE